MNRTSEQLGLSNIAVKAVMRLFGTRLCSSSFHGADVGAEAAYVMEQFIVSASCDFTVGLL